MLTFTDESWDKLCDLADAEIQKAINDLPESIRIKAESIECLLDKYTWRENMILLGCYFPRTNGPIIIYIGQIFECECGNLDKTMASARQVYYHELAHAIGGLEEYQVRERGL